MKILQVWWHAVGVVEGYRYDAGHPYEVGTWEDCLKDETILQETFEDWGHALQVVDEWRYAA